MSATTTTARPAPAAETRIGASDWTAIGTQIRLLVTNPGRLAAARAILESDLDGLDRACSRFRPDSELAALDAADGRWVTLSPLLTEALGVALDAARDSDGDIDPTVGEAMSALGYDRDFALVAPSGPAIKLSARPVPGWRRISLDRGSRSLRMPPGTRLDLGATAKAWAADRAATRIAQRLRCGVLVSLGGDIATAGPAPRGGWRVRVQDVTGHPDDLPAGPAQTVALTGGALATSSTTARRWERGGAVLHHILNPRDGLPAPTIWRTVSVAAADCVTANVAATGAIIRGRAALARFEQQGIPARLVDLDGRVFTTGGWPPVPSGAERDR
ncbi:MAG TPA: FAD:protein FMN transferase [Actinocrinis sp.]|uniref:FAD:protein FMN transferase n=1 Tax=Actinocrinis sp. TaxID=1920516 RepID=UPI002D476A35|nr:FAD:protein FMN transferase [Actinocrinis sp.]HZU56371.1 FAD:protein FMN transferase [Actinocrinis sp.]